MVFSTTGCLYVCMKYSPEAYDPVWYLGIRLLRGVVYPQMRWKASQIKNMRDKQWLESSV